MGTAFPTYYDDATSPTLTDFSNTDSTNSSSYSMGGYRYSVRHYRQEEVKRKKELTKKEKEIIRAKRLHKSSFILKSETKPKTFKTKGYPFNTNKPKTFYL